MVERNGYICEMWRKKKNFQLHERINSVDIQFVWLSSISLRNNKYFGVVDNLPESTTEVKMGDTIQIKTDDISDWMYIDGNRLRGGYTIRVLRNRMTDTERKQFDKE